MFYVCSICYKYSLHSMIRNKSTGDSYRDVFMCAFSVLEHVMFNIIWANFSVYKYVIISL